MHVYGAYIKVDSRTTISDMISMKCVSVLKDKYWEIALWADTFPRARNLWRDLKARKDTSESVWLDLYPLALDNM
jgi:hypothetical protein